MRRRGFSLIEMLVVVAIIGVLGTLAIYTFNRVSRSAKVKQTQVTMQSLRAMLAEGENPRYSLNLSTRLTGAVGANVSVDSGSVTGATGRYGDAVAQTQLLMQMLSAIPANRATLQGLPPEATMNVIWVENMNYIPGEMVRVGNGFFICRVAVNGSSTPPPADFYDDSTMPPTGHWRPVAADVYVAPVLLDGWHNPIIFVRYPSKLNTASTTYDQDVLLAYGLVPVQVTGATNLRIVSPASVPYLPADWDGTNADTYTYATADRDKVVKNLASLYRPFFVSAGPDGGLSSLGGDTQKPQGDDNVYSFEE